MTLRDLQNSVGLQKDKKKEWSAVEKMEEMKVADRNSKSVQVSMYKKFRRYWVLSFKLSNQFRGVTLTQELYLDLEPCQG